MNAKSDGDPDNARNKNEDLQIQEVSTEDADSRVDHATSKRNAQGRSFEEDDSGEEEDNGIRLVVRFP